MERMTGIEPALSAWEANVIPLHYIRILVLVNTTLNSCRATSLLVLADPPR